MGAPMHFRWSHLYKGTAAEHSLEEAIAELGVPYRTQFPGFTVGWRYFPDFLLPTLKLVIEVDDDSHLTPAKRLADAERTDDLGAKGYRVVRCTNADALSNPRQTVQRLLRSAGLWPIPGGLPKLHDSLPKRTKPIIRPKPKKGRKHARNDSNARRGNPSRGGSRPTGYRPDHP